MKRLLVGLVVSVAMLGCNTETLTVVKLDPGAECARGGVKILVPGQDPQVVCNGADGTGTNGTNGTNGTDGTNGTNGVTTLVTQTQLPAGDARCPRGGVEVQAGLDSGGDGGVPGDGMLQGGEVTSSTVVCTGDDGARVGSFTPPAGAAGTSVIRANGGVATRGSATGGSISIGMASGTNGGHVKVWKTGHADASFTVPTLNAGELGALPLNVTTNTTLPYSVDGATVPPGSPFINETGLYFAGVGPAAPRPITGLTVAAGATLTLPGMPSVGYWPAMGTCRVDGTLAWAPGAGSSFGLSCLEVVLSASSRVDGRALMGRTVNTSLFATRGHLLALGTIDVSGDVAPAAGGTLVLQAVEVYTGGTIVATGAPGMAGGSVQIDAVIILANGASIDAKGGARQGGGIGGAGGTVNFSLNNLLGVLKNRGAIDVSGGAALSCSECNSGAGGHISFTTVSTGLINDAALTAKGGESSDFAAGGGTVQITLGSAFPYSVGGEGSVLISGTIDVSGGDGPSAGTGGSVDLVVSGGAADGTELVLLGYASVEANGGVGTTGGSGGSVRLYQSPQLRGSTPVAPGGAVLATADLSAKGGEATQFSGGAGGYVTFATQSALRKAGADWEQVRSFGALSVNGGQGNTGGAAGFISALGLSGVRVEGTVEARGGLGTAGVGGVGGIAQAMAVHGRLENTAAWNVSAGDSGGNIITVPARGGEVGLVGRQVVNSGTLRARGGSGSLMGGVGGAGGVVYLTSDTGFVTQNTVAAPAGIDVSGGMAGTAGVAGRVVIDGDLVTAQWTH